MVTDTVRNRIVLFGGRDREDTWVFDGAVWSQLQTNLTPVRSGTAVAFDHGNANIVMFGGFDPYAGWALKNDTWVFENNTWQQVVTNTAPSARHGHAMAYDEARDEVVMFGGFDIQGIAQTDTWVWDGANWQQRNPTTSPAGWQASMAYDAARARIVMVTWNATWEWDGTTWHHIPTASSPPGYFSQLVYRPDLQRVIRFGGHDGTNLPPSDETWSFDGVNWTRLTTSGAIPGRDQHGFAWDPVSARPIVFGGRASSSTSSDLGDTWALSGNTWSPVAMATEPQQIQGMAYDSSRDRVVAVADWGWTTWEFDGTWSQVPSQTTPGFHWTQPMVFDSWRNATIAFSTVFEHKTWEWYGAGWTEVLTAHKPSRRTRYALGFDPVRGVTVLFAGDLLQSTQAQNETWEYDGVDWVRRFPTSSPTALEFASMAFHAPSSRLVLFGGQLVNGGGLFDATWEYDGITWTQRNVQPRPPARSGAALVPDPVTGDLILTGGKAAQSIGHRDAWRWDGNAWHATPAQNINRRILLYAAADANNALLYDYVNWWRWTNQPAITLPATGSGCGNPAPELVVDSRPFLGNPWFRVSIEPTQPDALFALFADFSATSTPLPGGCIQQLSSPTLLAIGCATPTGFGQTTLAIPRASALRGAILHMQGLAGITGGPLAGVASLTNLRSFLLGD